MTSVEVQSPPPPEPESTPSTGERAPSSVYEWLSTVPVAYSLGSTLYDWYEGSKNYARLSKRALDSVESSVKYVADTAAPVVKGPIGAVDSFAAKQLVKLEEKVPSIKTETGEVLEALSVRKNAVYSTIGYGKDAVTGRLTSGKDAIATRLSNGKDAISSTLNSGKEALCSCIQASSEALGNTRAGALVGCGVNCTLKKAENLVDYLLPEQKEEGEASIPKAVEEEEVESEMKDESSGEESGDEQEEEEGGASEEVGESRVARMKNLSRKVKRRIYYRTLRRLDSLQQQCKTTLEQLKEHVELLSSVRGHINSVSSLMACSKTQKEPTITLLDDHEQESNVESVNMKEKATLVQGALDYAKQLSEKVFTAFQSISKVTTYLPHHLKSGASQAFTYSQELYTTLKSAKVPRDVPTSALNRISDVVETQLGYVKQLGTYIRTSLQAHNKTKETQPNPEQKVFSIPDEAQEDGSNSELGDPGDPPVSRPLGEGGSQTSSEDET